MSRVIRYNTLDVLTEAQFSGVPVAVFASAEGLDPKTMTQIASSLNLPECVFLFRAEKGIHSRARAFSPFGEKALAGASVLAASWILGAHLVIPYLRLQTSAGLLEIEMERSGDPLHRALWSTRVPELVSGPDPGRLRASLGMSRNSEQIVAYRGESAQCLVEVSGAELRALSLDPKELAAGWQGGVLAYCLEDGVRARYFSAGAGLRESLVELSAAAVLGHHLLTKAGSARDQELAIEFDTELGRPATVFVSSRHLPPEAPALRVGGAAVVTGRGELALRS